MPDRLLRGVLPEHNFRFAICQTAELASQAIHQQGCDWMGGWLLGEALTCGALLSVNLKGQERITLRWDYEGPVGQILVELGEDGEVRGYTQKKRLVGHAEDLDTALGDNGTISASSSFPKKLGRTGVTHTVFQNLAKDLGHFLSLSFQTETALALGLIMPPEEPPILQSATGVLVQPLPGADLERFEILRKELESESFSTWMESTPRELEEILAHFSNGEEAQILSEVVPRFECKCSREKVQSMLQLLDSAELHEMMEEDQGAQVDCHFCSKKYHFSRTDLESLLERSQPGHG